MVTHTMPNNTKPQEHQALKDNTKCTYEALYDSSS